MAAVIFPSSPTDGQEFISNGVAYIYDATNNLWDISASQVPNELISYTDITATTSTTTSDTPSLNFDNQTGTFTFTPAKPPSETNLNEFADVSYIFDSETLTINVDAPGAGHGTDWLWTWNAGAVAYQRLKITNQSQANVPLYLGSQYTVNNFAAHELHDDMTQTHNLYFKWIDGPGTQNLVPWAVKTESVSGVSHPNINGGTETEIERLSIAVPTSITPPVLTPPTVTYDVSFVNAGAYTFTGIAHGENPDFHLYKGGTYTFNLDSSLSGHPFYITTDDGTYFVSDTYYGEYTDGVTGSRNNGSTGQETLVFTVPSDAPSTLYYQCGIHGSMRGTLEIRPLQVEQNAEGNYVLYFQHTQQGHQVPAEIRPKPTLENLGDGACLVFDTTSQKFVVTDMGLYLDGTTQFQSKISDLVAQQTANKTSSTEVSEQIKNEVLSTINLKQSGQLQLLTGTSRWYAPYNLQIVGISARLLTAADSIVTVNVKNSGTLAKTITFSPNSNEATIADQTISMSSGDYLTVDIGSIGTNTVGSDLYLQFTYKKV